MTDAATGIRRAAIPNAEANDARMAEVGRIVAAEFTHADLDAIDLDLEFLAEFTQKSRRYIRDSRGKARAMRAQEAVKRIRDRIAGRAAGTPAVPLANLSAATLPPAIPPSTIQGD